MSRTVIEVRDLCKHFVLHQQGGTRIDALDSINFSVRAGECVALFVIVHCPQGEVDIASADPRTVSMLRRTCISYVSQFLRVIPRVSTMDIVAEPLLNAGVRQKTAYERAATLLARLNLPQRLWNLAPATFSGGEQQRVNIARGFIRPTPILLLDEPTASLDAKNRKVVVELIREACANGCAVVGIFHDDDTREKVATSLVHINERHDAELKSA